MDVLLFPGQGTQYKGMGQQLWEDYAHLADTASHILGYSVVELCLHDPQNRLQKTQYTQPALYVVNALNYYRWQEQGGRVDALAGHSLGEYSALLAAGCFDFEMGLRLVQKRGQLMGEADGGTMAAVLGIREDALRTLLHDNGLDTIDLANLNSPTQIVIAGDTAAIATVEQLLTTHGVRCIILNVSAPFHSRYMRDAQYRFSKFLHGFTFNDPCIPVIANATARPYGDGQIASLLAQQIASPVLWTDSIRYLMEQGDFTYTEIGADPKRTGGSVLSKLVDEIRLDQPSSPGLTSVPLAVTWHCLNEDSMDIKNQNHFAELDQIILEIFDRQPLDAQPHYVADIDCGDGSLLRRVYEVVSTRTARGRSFNTYPLTLIGAVHNEQVLTATEKILQGLPHILVRGDVSHPKEWMDSLTAAGIPGLDNILHVHSFLCEERPCLSLAHLRHWKVHLSRFGLVLLEMHSPRTELAECLDSMVGQVCSDAASAFAGKTKVKASTFLMAAAENGLFPRTGAPRRLSKTADGAQVGLYHLMPKSYVIRHPRAEDWPHLVQVDRISQPEHLWTSRAELERRVKDLAQHSMVLEVAGNIVGALYAQRTDAIEPLKGCRHDELTPLYQAQGRYVQLLGLYIVPASHGHGHSDALIDCMLSYATALDGVRAVLGITRCADFVLHRQEFNLEQYVQIRNEHGQPLDPMLYFHVSHGANLHGPVPGYRPEDTDNQGAGVLIEYCLQSMAESGASHARPAPRSIEPPQIVQLVSDTVLQVLGEERAAAYDDQVPLMSMGLTSLELLKLRRLLSDRINQPLEATFFFRCGTPQAVIEELAAQMSFSATLPFSNTLPQQEALSDKMAFKVTPSETIAIVGMACRLPGGVRSPEQFWQLLSEERDTVGPLSEPRRKLAQETGQALRWPSAFVEDVDGFDAGFFRISPHEAEWLDPQQRLLLEVGWETLESAAIAPASLRGSRSGVFVGIMGSDYEALLRRNATDKGVEAHFATGSACSVAAGRLSYFLDWHGPALAIDTACSSSLVAVHTACRSLLGGECDLALATGVNLLLDDVRFEAYERAGMLSPEGHCKTFDAAADGYVRGEGCAAVLLKRLGDAQAASDRILGIIRGSAINQDGSSTGLTAPNQLAQQAVIEAALAQSKVAPHEVSYLEAHGTGTKLGDPIEVMAAAEVLGQGRSNHMPLWIGSVKSVIGHLEAAAGIAGLLKTVLAIRYGQLPAQRHYERPNPHIPWERLPVRVVAQAQTWPAGRKVAGVSSFGFSGTNAHVVVEEYVALQQAQTPSDGLVLVVLSARNEERLKAQAEQLLLHLARHKENLVDLAYTLQVGREAMGRRLALVVPTLESLKDKLIVYGAGDRTPEVGYFGQVKSEKQALKLLGGKETVTQIRRDKVTQGKLDEIAAGWVQGLSVDWTQLYGEVKPRRLNLPTYSFAPERYWIPKAELDASRPTLVSSGQQLSAGQPEQMQHLLEKQTPANPEVPLSTEQGLCLGRKHLVGLNGLDLTQCVVQDLTEQVAQLLKLPSEMLEPETNLAEYGVDSIVLTGFRQKLNARYNLTLSRAVFFEALTIMQLSVYLVHEHGAQLASKLTNYDTAFRERGVDTPTRSKFEAESIALTGMDGSTDNSDTFWKKFVSQTFLKINEYSNLTNTCNSLGTNKHQLKVGYNLYKNKPEEIVLLNDSCVGQPIFWIHAAGMHILQYQSVAEKSQRPFYGLQPPLSIQGNEWINGLYARATYYVALIRSFQPKGPYDIGGYSLGAVLAHEVVRQLQALGEAVNSLVMIDPVDPHITQQLWGDTADESELAINSMIFREVNFVLGSTSRKDRKQSLIHRDDIQTRDKPDIFLRELLSIAKTRGFEMTEQRLRSRVAIAHAVLSRSHLYDYKIKPLSKPNETKGYLFLNGSRRFYGPLESYCLLREGTTPDGECDYSQAWKKACDGFSTAYLDSSSHFMMLFEPESMSPCLSICEELYRNDPLIMTGHDA